MGLDMYLSTKSNNAASVAEKNEISKRMPNYEKGSSFGDIPLTFFSPNQGFYSSIKNNQLPPMEEIVAYWRKSYQVHTWLEKHFLNGITNNRRYEVRPEMLRELFEISLFVKATKISSPLPIEGNEQYYWEDLDLTIKQLENIVQMPDFETTTFTYLAWW